VLRTVIEEYIASGVPVGSRYLSERFDFGIAASTIRNDLAELEDIGMLAHPHTSSGRVPTDAGYRHYVDTIIVERRDATPAVRIHQDRARSEIDDALRETADALSRVTELLAVVSAPAVTTSTIRHIEVLALQPQVVLVVIITSTGSVSKMLATFERAVDAGLVSWAAEYLNERLVGLELGARMLQQRLVDPSLSARELAFLERFAPAFGDLACEGEDALYVEGTACLFEDAQIADATNVNELIGLLERRVALLRVLRTALGEPGIYVRIGHENELPAMHSLALVATGYGMARRKLGTVSLIGPVRMDYAGAIATVREAAHELSRFVEDTYAET